jgi:archaellum component FlaC
MPNKRVAGVFTASALLAFSGCIAAFLLRGAALTVTRITITTSVVVMAAIGGRLLFKTVETAKSTSNAITDLHKRIISTFNEYISASMLWMKSMYREYCVFACGGNPDCVSSDSIHLPYEKTRQLSSLLQDLNAVGNNGHSTELRLKKAHGLISLIEEITRGLIIPETDVNSIEKRKKMHERVLENTYACELTRQMVESIREHIDLSAKPLSEEIFLIKKIVYLFQQSITEWRDELADGQSKKNFESVIAKYDRQNEKYRYIAENLEHNFRVIEENFNLLISMIENIFANSEQIKDISAKINLLSINAAIESTKAGVFGRGFKVISSEIVKLSGDTRVFADKIKSVIEATKKTASDAIAGFNANGGALRERITNQREDFEEFYRLLTGYNEDFRRIFSLVENVSNDINTHIRKVNPVFQHQDITIQQIDNLKKIIDIIYTGTNENELLAFVMGTIDTETRKAIITHLIEHAERIVTTDYEIEIINRIAEKYRIGKTVQMSGSKKGEIELF